MTQIAPPTSDRAAIATSQRDLRPLWRAIAAGSLVLGSLLVSILRGIMPYWTSDDAAAGIGKIAAAPGRIAAMNWIAILSYPFLILGAVTLWLVVRRAAPVLGTVAAGLYFTGLTLGSMLGGSDVLAEVMTKAGYDRAVTVEVTTAFMEHPAGLVGLFGFVFGHIVGLVLVAVALLRSRLVPVWAGLGLALAQPVHVIAAVAVPSRALDVIGGWGLTTLIFAVIARAILAMPIDECDPRPASATAASD
ncbi:MAG: hypothetical protein V9G19_02195 [Tetrasphaera sp.]